jgi:ZIP family zinc transporter
VGTGTALWLCLSLAGTAAGGAALLAFRRPPRRAVLDALLGFTAGVMLAAVPFSLLVPGLELGAWWEVSLGFVAGAGFLLVLDHVVPHIHEGFDEPGRALFGATPEGRRALLLLSALTIHNIPEGLAIGFAFAAGGDDLGIPLAIAITIQNIPEGFATGAPLLVAGRSRWTAALVGAATGLVEVPAAFAAYWSAEAAGAILPYALGFAAGAMLYVVVDELVPEAEGHGNERLATIGAMAGFVLLLALDNALV